MFTIKHIELSGTETLYQAAKPVFHPKDNSLRAAIEFDVANNEVARLEGGTVFVMNDGGKTIARYDLGASNVPLGLSVNLAANSRQGISVSSNCLAREPAAQGYGPLGR